jgi:hypothetical protein
VTGGLAPDARQLPRDVEVREQLRNSFGTTEHAGHFDGGLADISTWPGLRDGIGSKARPIDRPGYHRAPRGRRPIDW